MHKPYYQRGGVTLYHGDACRVGERIAHPYYASDPPVERGIVLFDPPYSPRTHSKSRAGAGKAVSKDVDFGFCPLSSWLRRALAHLSVELASRWVLVFSDPELSGPWRWSLQADGDLVTEDRIRRAELGDEDMPEGLRLDYVRTGAWVKIGATPQFTGDRPAAGHDEITICHRAGVKKRWNGGGSHALRPFPVIHEKGGIDSEPRLHPTQKPLDLMLRLVELFSEPGEVVYDLTCGSGTTGVACLRARGPMPGPRRFVGVELDEAHCEKAAKRLDAELDGSTYGAAKVGQLGMFPT
jgi:site-specific DNA-methyltransferase (adenine-specific)